MVSLMSLFSPGGHDKHTINLIMPSKEPLAGHDKIYVMIIMPAK